MAFKCHISIQPTVYNLIRGRTCIHVLSLFIRYVKFKRLQIRRNTFTLLSHKLSINNRNKSIVKYNYLWSVLTNSNTTVQQHQHWTHDPPSDLSTHLCTYKCSYLYRQCTHVWVPIQVQFIYKQILMLIWCESQTHPFTHGINSVCNWGNVIQSAYDFLSSYLYTPSPPPFHRLVCPLLRKYRVSEFMHVSESVCVRKWRTIQF